MNRRRSLAILALLTPLAIGARWGWYQDGKGAAFLPSPDSLEYVASAQSIASEGRFYLQIGPEHVRARYSPGWPMLQAVALAAGVEGADVWRFTALFGVLLAVGVALATTTAIEGARRAPPTARDALVPVIFGLGAGALWCVSPLAADSGGTAMSDEPTAFVCFAALACASVALLRDDRAAGSRRSSSVVGWSLFAGLCAGQALAMRTVEGLLLAPPLAWLAIHGARLNGWARVRRVTLAALCGALIPIGATMVVLARSGLSPWQWSAYPFWAPERFGSLDVTFSLRYAWIANPHIPAMIGAEHVGQLRAYASTFLGLVPPHGWAHFGTIWPALGWLALTGLMLAWVIALRRTERAPTPAAPATVAVAGWCLSHWLVFGAYFYPDPRFVLGALAWCPVTLATALGTLALSPNARVRRGAWLAAALVTALALGDAWARHPKRHIWQAKNEDTREAVERWLAWDDDTRSDQTIPFDPVMAQALGLLAPERTRTIHEWGQLPGTKQVNLLRRNGYFDRMKARSDQLTSQR